MRKILRTDATAFSYERERQPLPRLGGHVVALERMLEENQSKSRRERLTVIADVRAAAGRRLRRRL